MIQGFDKFFYIILLVILLPIAVLIYKKRSKHKIYIASQKVIPNIKTFRVKFKNLPFYLALLSFTSFMIAIAEPYRYPHNKKKVIDICLTFDVSYSMISFIDYKPNRLEASKKIISNLIDEIDDARFGLVVFASQAFELVPMTFDKNIVKINIQKLNEQTFYPGFYEATAIGDALYYSYKSLSNSNDVKEKIIILATDGDNNSGIFKPWLIADSAKTKNIRIYTIAIGKNGLVESINPFTGSTVVTFSNFNEALLKEIAYKTNANYYNAENPEDFKKILKEIYELERTKIDIPDDNKILISDIFFQISLLFILFAALLRYFIFIKIQ